MKRILISLIVLALLSSCAKKPLELSDSMRIAMRYATAYEEKYPDGVNVAEICRKSQIGVYYSSAEELYIVACITQTLPAVYGIVSLDEYTVRSTCTVNSDQGDINKILYGLGYEKKK